MIYHSFYSIISIENKIHRIEKKGKREFKLRQKKDILIWEIGKSSLSVSKLFLFNFTYAITQFLI